MKSFNKSKSSGFSLIEVVIVLVIMGVLLGKGLPAFTQMMRDLKIRGWAESVSQGIQLARNEAIKKNRQVRFQLVTDLSISCTSATAGGSDGTAWVVSTYADIANAPPNNCKTVAAPVLAPGQLQTNHVIQSTAVESGNLVQTIASSPIVCFNALGLECNNTGNIVFEFRSAMPGIACSHDPTPGPARCLKIFVSPSGSTRMCDPAISVASDPRKC